jgi:hypothetical protein
MKVRTKFETADRMLTGECVSLYAMFLRNLNNAVFKCYAESKSYAVTVTRRFVSLGRQIKRNIHVPLILREEHRLRVNRVNINCPCNRLWMPIGCEMLRIPHCLDNRLTDGGKVVSPTHWTSSTPEKHYFSASGTHFCWRLRNIRA